MELSFEGKSKVVGLKQTKRALQEDAVASVYAAEDAEERILAPVLALCREKGIPIVPVASMKELGDACSIDVDAAIVALLKEA